MEAVIYIDNGNTTYIPVVEEGIQWSTDRKSTPGKLTFQVVDDGVLQIEEGNAVRLCVDGTNVFYGFIFKKDYKKNNMISITAYDQLRYLNNKDTYVYVGKKASELLAMIAADFELNTGVIEDTGYVIPQKSESNKKLFDIIQNALDSTLLNTGKLYCLYDDFGHIALKNVENMLVPLLIDEETAQSYDYSSSIDDEVYNQIKLTFDNEKTGKREVYLARDNGNINKWGILQYYDTIKEGENGQAKADALLKLYNKKSRKLKMSGVLGDVRVRAGYSVMVSMKLPDVEVQSFLLCEKVVHTFKNEEHTMAITLRGGDFIA